MNVLANIINLNLLLITLVIVYHIFFLIVYILLKLIQHNHKEILPAQKNNFFCIIVPAHNEELMIGGVVENILNVEYPKDKYELFVIADNCTDNTAKIARDNGANCLERQDLTKRGKPYAIDWFLQRINISHYDAFTVIDADTHISKKYLHAMNEKLNNGSDAIQGYFGVLNPEESWLTRLMVIPGVLKFKIRYFSKEIIGLSCPLMGNGMCFSKKIIQNFGWNAYSITENWEYYLMLVLNNYNINYSQDAVIYSHAVTSLGEGKTQRKRWLRGKIQLIKKYAPKLLISGMQNNFFVKADAIAELIIPSYSMLFNWNLLVLIFALPMFLFKNIYMFHILTWASIILLIQIGYFFVGLLINRAPLMTWVSLMLVPAFLAWKLSITIVGIIGIRNNEWKKTTRK